MNDEITIMWHIGDVKYLDDTLSDEECRRVLQYAKDEHNATIGINWEVLYGYIDIVKGERI